MAGLTAWLHQNGLLAGIYTDAGYSGCNGRGVGSRGHYQQDANTFAAWGFDAVKMDFCGAGQEGMAPQQAYTDFSNALSANASHRPMLLNVCNFWVPGQIDGTLPTFANSSYANYQWAPQIAQSWRTDTDVGFTGSILFTNVLRNFDHNAAHPEAAGPGHWNDPDYLGPELGMTSTEAQSQFSMWAMLAAPLILGSDPRKLSSTTVSMLENARVIAIDQDPRGAQGTLAQQSGSHQVWVKRLANGDSAVALFNRGANASQITTSANALGLGPANSYQLQDLWANTTTTTSDQISAVVPSHGVVLYRVTPAPGTTATLSASPGSVAAGGSVTVTWSGVAAPTGTDWVGLYTPGAANTAYLDWVYDDSCTKTSNGTTLASGSCTFTMPSVPGTYQLRLLAKDGYTVLATSSTITVTG